MACCFTRFSRKSLPPQPCLPPSARRDKAWSVNRLGRIARLHHQPEACVQIINTQYGFNAMEVQEAFVKASCRTAAVLLLVLLLYLPTCCTP